MTLSRLILPVLAATSFNFVQAQNGPTVHFVDQSATELTEFGHVRLGYPSCGSDGTIFVNIMLDPSKSWATHIVSISPTGKVQTFEFGQDKHLREGASVRSFSPRAGAIDLLISGLPSVDFQQTLTDKRADQFILHYDLNGQLETIHSLPSDYRFARIMNDSNGTTFALGSEKLTGLASMMILADDGKIAKKLDLGEPVLSEAEARLHFKEISPDSASHDLPLVMQMDTVLGSKFQLAADGDDILVLKPAPDAKIFRIRAKGVVQATKLNIPPNSEMRWFFPNSSATYTMVGFAKGGTAPALVQFDENGKYINMLHLDNLSEGSAVCKQGESYYGLGFKQGKAILLTGHLASNLSSN
jgi:hypothetical protein